MYLKMSFFAESVKPQAISARAASGSTGLAAQNLNREFVGVEKDKVYYEEAKARMMANV